MAEPAPEPDHDIQTHESVIDSLQKKVEELLKTIEKKDKMINKRNTIIQTMSKKIEEDGIQFVVLARNAYGLSVQPDD